MNRFSNHIHGDKFVELCDYIIRENDSPIDPEQLKSNKLVFCKTDQIRTFFDIVRHNPNRFVLITHNSDHNITPEVYSLKPPCITRWFAQNALVQAPDLVPIPIGLERPGIAGSGNIQDLSEVFRDRDGYNNLVYLNIAPSTNYLERGECLAGLENKPWVKRQGTRIPFRHYLKDIAESKYTAAPPGNGHDTHRLWEALYMGSIPIVVDSPANREFSKIYPILMIKSWSDLQPQWLTEQAPHILFDRFNIDKTLNFSYWEDQIRMAKRAL